ncbi:hypothetical protein L6164_030727 [Bauhinia variegata]|uniref:Uncharacterized protein n=1 Tax=Bauhinia variegata TaxID=167791 RepID=A0ACB9LDL4_BAUVA|nr:hypothetical protein L6164_030727 [Bauhinia variegata]
MGNNRFRLSDMMPNAWFYKLKDMSRARKRNGSHSMKNKVSSPTASQRSQPRYPNYFPTETSRAGKLYNSPIYIKDSDIPFLDSPRRSSKRRSRRKTIYKPSPTVFSSSHSATGSCHSTNSRTKPNQIQSPDYYASSTESSSESDPREYVTSDSESDGFAVPDLFNGLASNCSCRVSSSTNDIIIDMNHESFRGDSERLDGFDTISELDLLPPILTKPVRFDDKIIEADELRNSSKLDHHLPAQRSLSVKTSKEESTKTQRERKLSPLARKSSTNSTGIRLRVHSPKLASRKVQAYARRSVSSNASKASGNTSFPEGFAVVKSSLDPQRDFRESMVEMIVENNIRASKDLEDLLACYLSLNSSEYHDLIVKAFEQIWFDMAQLRL